jgi:peptide/nickel transport system permease protein
VTGALQRLALAALTLLGVGIVVFVLLRVAPGDPVSMMISPSATPADVAALRAHYGLDRPLVTQFGLWLFDALRLDFGDSISLRRHVLELMGERFPATLELAFAAFVFGALGGGLVAVAGALARGTALEAALDFVNGLFLAVPDFVWAMTLVLLIGVAFPILPLSGRIDPAFASDFVTPFYLIESVVRGKGAALRDILAHMAMPAMALGLPLAAIVARTLKEALCEAMVQDYVLLARLKGKSELRLVVQEALRNALGPTLSLTGVQFTFMIGGTVIIERIFAYPGVGSLAIDAVVNRDLPLIQGVVLAFGALFILLNLTVDLAIVRLDPRQAHG